MNTKKWTVKDGSKICIKDMTDSHLSSTIRMIERYYNVVLFDYDSITQLFDDWSMDQEISVLTREGPAYLFPIYKDLKSEAVRWGLLNPLGVTNA
jgi:hypothetical protein